MAFPNLLLVDFNSSRFFDKIEIVHFFVSYPYQMNGWAVYAPAVSDRSPY
jgi:hypothetical protein